MRFIKEYTLSDLSICDRLIDLYKDADKIDLTYAGRVGGGSVMPEVKKSRDFFIEDANPLGIIFIFAFFNCLNTTFVSFILIFFKVIDY